MEERHTSPPQPPPLPRDAAQPTAPPIVIQTNREKTVRQKATSTRVVDNWSRISICLGAFAIGCNFMCILSFFALPMGLAGLAAGFLSQPGKERAFGIALNAIAIGFSILSWAWLFLSPSRTVLYY